MSAGDRRDLIECGLLGGLVAALSRISRRRQSELRDVMKLGVSARIARGLCGMLTDLRTRRIPNVLTFGATAAALVFHAVTGQASGLLQSVEGWLVGAAIFFALCAGGPWRR